MKPNRQFEGFSIATLLSKAEADYIRAKSHRIQPEIDKKEFDDAKFEHRKNEIADVSFVRNYIDCVESIEIKKREEEVKVKIEERVATA